MSAMKNIILAGFMGTGKSTVGRIVADRLRWTFVDMDAVIEEREGRSIPRIFAESGEPYFRKLERALVQELASREHHVIAPGGGIVLNPDNARDFAKTGLVICLRAKPETILARVEHDANRPLLQGGDKLMKIRELLGKRQSLYDALPHVIDTDGLMPVQVADRVVELHDR